MLSPCLFCEIISGNIPSHRVWEDEQHFAFLSIFPNTEGVTVVVTKQHYPSYVFDLPTEVMHGLMDAAKTVAQKIDLTFKDVGRTGVVFEGFGINHMHAKLFPLHGTKRDTWQPIQSSIATFFEKYPGYISSHDAARADDERLKQIAEQIRNASKEQKNVPTQG